MRGREQDNGETEKERVLDCGALRREQDGIGNKIDCLRNTYGAKVRLISGVIENAATEVVPTIYIFSLLIYI